MTDLTVTLLQTSLHWQDSMANRMMFSDKIAAIGDSTDLIILPEMFTTGFSMDASTWAEDMDGPTLQWMAEEAQKVDAVITGSLIIQEDGHYYNRLIWMRPDGTYAYYDKRHLFAMAGEDEQYSPGSGRLIVTLGGWRICPMICYDLRFPIWSRNDDSYDLLIYIANWPDRRSYDWNTLLRARAIENQSYVAAVNRVGTDANGHRYIGDSCIIDPGWHQTLLHMKDTDATLSATLSYDHLEVVRTKLPFWKDADRFELR